MSGEDIDPRTRWQNEYLAARGHVAKEALQASTRIGKTRAATRKAQLLQGGWSLSLVVCPVKVGPTWMREFGSQEGFSDLIIYDAFSCSTAGALEQLQIAAKDAQTNHCVIVMNWAKFWRLVDDIIMAGIELFIGDESHNAKAAGSRQGKAYRRIGWRSKYFLALTGTLAPNHYGELWGQLTPIDPDTWGKSYEKYATKFLIRDAMFSSRVLGHRNVDELQAMLLRDVYTVRREDVFGADQWQYTVRELDLPDRARRLYDALVKDWLIQEPDYTVDASHILKRLVRLQQLVAGYAVDDLGGVHDEHTVKLDAVEADLSEIIASGEKACIFHVFRWEAEKYEALAKKMLGKHGLLGTVNGDTKAIDCDHFVSDFRSTKHPAIAVIQIRSGGVGLDFAEAQHGLRTSRSFSFVDDEQSINRIWKPQTVRSVTDYRIRRTVDYFLAAILATKRGIHDSVRKADIETMAYGLIATRRGVA